MTFSFGRLSTFSFERLLRAILIIRVRVVLDVARVLARERHERDLGE